MKELIRELREQRGKVIAEARNLVDKADAEKREMTTEETKRYDEIFSEKDKIDNRLKREEQLQTEERKMAEGEARSKDAETASSKGKKLSDEERQLIGFRSFIQTGALSGEGSEEFRALQADANTQGGYLVPKQFVAQLIKDVDDMVFMRELATVIPVGNADSLGIPSLENDPADADWTSELGTGSEDSTMSFGERELKPYPLAKRIKVSKKLLRVAALPAEQIIRERLAYKFGISEEKAFLTGSGAGQPLGVFTASADGISTGRDVSSGNTTSEMTVDGLKNAKYSLKMQYRRNARWMFHRDGVKQISKFKDGNGQYLWQPSLIQGDPDRFDGIPVIESEFAPNTFTTGQYVGILGDFSNYYIADSLQMELQRLVELYAATNQVGFIGRMELDGMPAREEAFARVKLG